MADSCKKFLIFSLQGLLYALDLNQIAEVSDPQPTWPIPRAPACFNGAINFHGDIVAVVNLSTFFGLHETTTPGKLVFLHQKIASLAFLVDAVVAIANEGDVTFLSPPGTQFAAAELSTYYGNAIQLDLDSIVCGAENRMIGSGC